MFESIPTLWFSCVFLLCGLSSFASDPLSVNEGKSFTLLTDVNINQKDIRIKWYFNNIRLAQISGADNSKTCSDDLCKERFMCRLKLDDQTGSLMITNTRTTDSGDYKLLIAGNGTVSEQIFSVSINGGAEALNEVSVIEGDSVTLHADVRADHDRNVWYYNESRIAQINGDLSRICTDDSCKERFGDRLQLDLLTASLTIMNVRETDAGLYKLTKRDGDKIFSVIVCGVPGAQIDKVKKKSVKEGESVTLDIGVIKILDTSTWYFDVNVIAMITGDLNTTCTGQPCIERFQERLSLNQTGSLTIVNTRPTDSGYYQLKMNEIGSSYSIERIQRFSLAVTASDWTDSARVHFAGAACPVLLFVVAVIIIIVQWRRNKGAFSAVENGSPQLTVGLMLFDSLT